jgi:hypothetical protein
MYFSHFDTKNKTNKRPEKNNLKKSSQLNPKKDSTAFAHSSRATYLMLQNGQMSLVQRRMNKIKMRISCFFMAIFF